MTEPNHRQALVQIRKLAKSDGSTGVMALAIKRALEAQIRCHGELAVDTSTIKRITGAVANCLDNIIQRTCGQQEMREIAEEGTVAIGFSVKEMKEVKKELEQARANEHEALSMLRHIREDHQPQHNACCRDYEKNIYGYIDEFLDGKD